MVERLQALLLVAVWREQVLADGLDVRTQVRPGVTRRQPEDRGFAVRLGSRILEDEVDLTGREGGRSVDVQRLVGDCDVQRRLRARRPLWCGLCTWHADQDQSGHCSGRS